MPKNNCFNDMINIKHRYEKIFEITKLVAQNLNLDDLSDLQSMVNQRKILFQQIQQVLSKIPSGSLQPSSEIDYPDESTRSVIKSIIKMDKHIQDELQISMKNIELQITEIKKGKKVIRAYRPRQNSITSAINHTG
ncbi:MAG: hypothetical protein A2161_00550 [Candidatus Schekmanbacteria bacterium RBG_13_48_7]|uniref:Flagellar protein FliT n=1 Tax=Candidatus Schekmanbacteria bacterium RBG_13_48_7 TaxID=1817878 RepID=A0A1F7RKI6_9BACT|nr:MAG: hypothetical protein A2161_00550 [Candidatus Schekmanbacteria bacterium RBG_13_48_7]